MGCLILAAGRSQRFGRTRINKLLAPIAGRPMIQSVLQAALRSSARPIVVVSGHQRSAIDRALRPLRSRCWRLRFNRHHRRGMSSSIIAGLRALPDNLDGVLIALGDMPALDPRVIDQLIHAFEASDDAVIARSAGQRGNPVLIGRSLFADLEALRGDIGARRLLQQGSRKLRFIEADRSVIADIDTRRDWMRFIRR